MSIFELKNKIYNFVRCNPHSSADDLQRYSNIKKTITEAMSGEIEALNFIKKLIHDEVREQLNADNSNDCCATSSER